MMTSLYDRAYRRYHRTATVMTSGWTPLSEQAAEQASQTPPSVTSSDQILAKVERERLQTQSTRSRLTMRGS